MPQVKLEDVILDRLIDVIQNGVKDSSLRDEYDRFMSDRNYNNADMMALHEHAVKMVELGWEGCRNDRDEDRLIDLCCDEAVSQGIAIWVTGDKRLADQIEDDRVWRDLQAGAREWDKVEDDYERATRRGGRDRNDRNDRNDHYDRNDRGGRSSGRNDRNTGLGYNQSRPPTGNRRDERDERSGRTNTRMTGGFGGGARNNRNDRDERSSHVPRESARNTEDTQQPSRRNSSPLARPARQQETQEVERQESRLQRHQEPVDDVIEKNAGPDLNSPRPFDDFWDNGERWQLAHVSEFKWVWSPKQQTRRSYEPDQEVCFLVQSADGSVREEFLPMTDQLSFAANEIKSLTRPNDGRRIRNSDGGGAIADVTLPGRDLDAVDLDAFAGKMDEVRRTLITELDLNSNILADHPSYASTMRDGLIRAATLRLQSGKDIAAVQNIIVELVPSSGAGLTELESLGNLLGADADMTTLQKRLQALRGKVDESVLDHIDEHFTAEVNHSLTHGFGFGGKLEITSFIDDYADMLAVMTKNRGAGYTSQYLSRTRNLVPTLAIMSNADGRKDVIAAQDLLPEAEADTEAYIAYRENMVVVLKSSASVSVAVDVAAFGVVDDEPRVATGTGPGADPELRDALNALYLVARKASPPGRVHVTTADNVILELVGIAGARDVVGVRRV